MAKTLDLESNSNFGRTKPTILTLSMNNSNQLRLRVFFVSCKEAKVLIQILLANWRNKLKMPVLRPTTTTNIYQPLENCSLNWLMILDNLDPCLKYLLQSCILSSKFIRWANSIIVLPDWSCSSRWPAMKLSLGQVTISTETWLHRP